MALIFATMMQAATAARPGVVTGQLQTRDGAPVAAIRLSAVVAPPPNIRPGDGQEYYSTAVPVSTTLSDAQGRYRLTNLAPGRYFIVASVFGYPTYYPSVTSADRATVVTVAAEAPSTGIDFSVQLPPGGRVSGRIDKPSRTGTQEKVVLSGVSLGELIESPVGADGGFVFGHLPTGSYLLSLFPAPPGMPSKPFRVEQSDVRVDLVRPTLRTVSGQIVVQKGPLPYSWLGFLTESSYQTAHINADGTFRTELQPARHTVELAGVPGGYGLASVLVGNQDASKGLVVGESDISNLTITIATPANLPRLRGKVTGVPTSSLTSAKVQLTGHIIGTLEAPVKPDGSFEFPAVTPGSYQMRVPQVAAVPASIVVIGFEDVDVQIGAR